MKIIAHCFAENVNISPTPFLFRYKDYDVEVISLEKQLQLQISKTADEHDLENIKKSDSDRTDKGEGIKKKMMLFKYTLTEVAQILEGLFTLQYVESVPPKFDTSRVIVNIKPETDEDKSNIKNNIVHTGFGDFGDSQNTPTYLIDNSINSFIEPTINNLPAFSFFAQATRSFLKDNENEIAFFLFFRIIDGYFADGVSDVQKALIKKANELEQFFNYDDDELKQSTKLILNEMGLKSKSEENFIGLIADIVLIRHKLTHFSTTKAKNHHSAKIIFLLFTLNVYMYRACGLILMNKISAK